MYYGTKFVFVILLCTCIAQQSENKPYIKSAIYFTHEETDMGMGQVAGHQSERG